MHFKMLSAKVVDVLSWPQSVNHCQAQVILGNIKILCFISILFEIGKSSKTKICLLAFCKSVLEKYLLTITSGGV